MIVRASIATTATNTAVGFTLLGLVTVIVFLIANAISIFGVMKNFPVPEIKSVVVQNLGNGPAKVYMNIEFPGRKKGHLISAKTEGPLKISVNLKVPKELSRNKKEETLPAFSLEIPNGIDLNFGSQESTNLIIDDLQIKFDKKFDARIISDLLMSKVTGNFSPQLLPKVKINLETRVVLKSLWIPVGASFDFPYEIDLAKILEKRSAASASESNSKSENEMSPRELAKAKAIKAFQYTPRSVKVSASDNDKLEITVVSAFPAALIPDFLNVEVPEMSFQSSLFGLDPVEEGKARESERMVQLKIDRFVAAPAPESKEDHPNLFQMTLLIEKSDVSGLKKLLSLVRDEQKHKIGLQIKQNDHAIPKMSKNGLMYWLKEFVLDFDVGALLKQQEEARKKAKLAAEKKASEQDAKRAEENEAKKANEIEVKEADKEEKGGGRGEETSEDSATKIFSKAVKAVRKNLIITSKLLKTKKLVNGGSLIFQIKILHSFVEFFVGKLPEIDLQANLMDGTGIARFKISSNEVTAGSESIDINIEVGLINLKEIVYTGLRAGDIGTEELHKQLPEIKAIDGLKIWFASDNVISELARTFNFVVYFGQKGVEKVKFEKSDRIIYPAPKAKAGNPEEDFEMSQIISLAAAADGEATKAKKLYEVFTKFAVENEENTGNLNIGASINLPERPYSGDFAHVSWDNFTLKIKYKRSSVLIFKIHPGAVSVGVTGGIQPFYAELSTGVTVPASVDKLKILQELLKSFLKAGDELIDLSFEVNYGLENEHVPFVLNALIPCKKLMFAPVEEKEDEDKDEDDEKKELLEGEEDKKDSDAAAAEKKHERSDFLSKVTNSIVSFVSFQATTLFFHVTYPDGHYCPAKLDSDYDLKINVDVALPMIEANVCATDDPDDDKQPMRCFASAGVSRPMTFSAHIIDGQICEVKSVVLPQETVMAGLQTTQTSTDFDFKYLTNEIPIHLSVLDLPSLIRFVEMVAGQRVQTVTIGPVDQASSINKFIGIVASSFVSHKFTPKSQEKAKKLLKEQVEKLLKLAVTVPYSPETPAVLEIGGSSKNTNELELLVGFRLPANAMEGMPTQSTTGIKFMWPVIQWGMFDYTFGVENIFEASFSMKRGEIEINKDGGIVVPALRNFGIRLRLRTVKSSYLGSTTVRQLIGILKNYIFTPIDQRIGDGYDSRFLKDIKDNKFYYKFTMNGPRGINDPSDFYARGDVPVKSMLDLFDAILNRPKLPELPAKVKASGTDAESQSATDGGDQNGKKDPFKSKRITLKTKTGASSSNDQLPKVSIPCLIPALCSDAELDSRGEVVFERSTLNFILELENILLPATEMLASTLGPLIKVFKMKQYPSNLELKVTVLSDLWLTLVIDGAGILSFGLSPFEFSRNGLIVYGNDNVTNLLPDQKVSPHDIFNLPLKIEFPETILGLRESLSVFRRSSMFLPAVPPLFYHYESTTAKKIPVPLSNHPFYISISSDDRKNPDRNNLLSAFIAAMVPETVMPAINPSDYWLNFVNGDYPPKDPSEKTSEKPADKTSAVEQSIETAAKQDVVQSKGDTGMGELGTSAKIRLATCLLSGINCDRQDDVLYNVTQPFAAEFLKLVLPSTTILRLYVEKAAILQLVLDARRQNRLEISADKGLNVLGTMSINLAGLDEVTSNPSDKTKNLRSYVWKDSTQGTPMRLQVITGEDLNLSANLHFPFWVLRSWISRQLPGQSLGTFFYRASEAFSAAVASKIETISPPYGQIVKMLTEEELKAARPEMRACLIDSELSPATKYRLLRDINYSKTAVFFEKDNPAVSVDKETTFYLQLRTDDDEVVCGQPIDTADMKLFMIRDDSEQGFVRVNKLFSYQSFDSKVPYKVEADIKFNHAFNLFTVTTKLSYPGRYKLKLGYQMSARASTLFPLTSAFIYVKNDH